MADQSKTNKPAFKGEILLCEDNELMQHIIKSQLVDVGFEVTVANNGKECVDIVSSRIQNGENPFSLIFLDIFMPVMDGIEAADTLTSLGNQAPLAALTANTEAHDVETHKAHNMQNSLSKPFTPEELWSFLYLYFTPLGFEAESKKDDEEDEKRNRLLTGFVKRNQTTYADIKAAIESGDIKLAHRLAHTLKGLAGLMGRTKLQELSQIVENSLADGNMDHIKEQTEALGHELQSVLDELSPLLDEAKTQTPTNITLNKAKALELLDQLEPLLRADSSKCRDFSKGLREIPGTAELIEQIEDYEFEKALELLKNLKESLGGQ